MKLIKEFFYWSWNPYTEERIYKGETVLRKEIERPIIEFNNSLGFKVKTSNFKYFNSLTTRDRNKKYEGVFYDNNHYSILNFNDEEILYLAKTFALSYEEEGTKKRLSVPKEYYEEVGENNIEDSPHISFKFLIDNDNNEYLIISFLRYPLGYPEIAKDQSDPYLTYIHGIWEKPLLTERIINKIKRL